MTAKSPSSWPREAWYQAAWSSEVAPGTLLARTLLGEPVVIFRDAAGKASVLEDRCCHRGTPLRLGAVTEKGLQCGYHGLVFDGGGRCVWIPGQDTIPPQARVRAYPTVERQEFIWIWGGDPARADPALLVDYPWNDDHANWPHKHGMTHVRCNYRLLIDNLMDLTHIPFIHRRTIGGGVQMEQVNARMETKRTPRGVHYIRWMLGSVPPPTYVKGAGFKPGVRVDRWQDFEYVAPGSVIQWSGALETGRGAEQDRNQSGGFSLRLYHGTTPETEDSSFYFWTPANGYRPGEPAATEELFREIAATFAEDVAFVEAQHASLTADPGRPLIDVKHDGARIHARRALERLMHAERAPAAAE
jgi:phenylpropionate dioxygenase-like ring-hydroxylating dioxygenase large terminal subunit